MRPRTVASEAGLAVAAVIKSARASPLRLLDALGRPRPPAAAVGPSTPSTACAVAAAPTTSAAAAAGAAPTAAAAATSASTATAAFASATAATASVAADGGLEVAGERVSVDGPAAIPATRIPAAPAAATPH